MRLKGSTTTYRSIRRIPIRSTPGSSCSTSIPNCRWVAGQRASPWCGVGQIAQDGSSRAYVTSYDHTKGQPGFFGGSGVWMISFQSQFGEFSPFAGIAPVAPNGGLAGDLPTSTALGPDGKLYVGFLKNGNIKRILNLGASGVAPQTRRWRVWVAHQMAAQCTTPRPVSTMRADAGTPQRIAGAIVAVATDAADKVYFSANGAGTVFRYTPADGIASNHG